MEIPKLYNEIDSVFKPCEVGMVTVTSAFGTTISTSQSIFFVSLFSLALCVSDQFWAFDEFTMYVFVIDKKRYRLFNIGCSTYMAKSTKHLDRKDI